jgi:hypothetical protein
MPNRPLDGPKRAPPPSSAELELKLERVVVSVVAEQTGCCLVASNQVYKDIAKSKFPCALLPPDLLTYLSSLLVVKDVRIQYTRRHCYRTLSNKAKPVKTPGMWHYCCLI